MCAQACKTLRTSCLMPEGVDAASVDADDCLLPVASCLAILAAHSVSTASSPTAYALLLVRQLPSLVVKGDGARGGVVQALQVQCPRPLRGPQRSRTVS